MDREFQNRLAAEKSPYLLQHAHNPVDWYPWGEEALDRAQRENRPIFVSIGYSTCHWCHVMERESFEDPETARRLNDSFVCIKVDREERPDVDEIYMAAVQAMTGQGGWPLNVFLTPDRRPFYGGTYWPPEDRYGRPGFARVVTAMADAWNAERHKVVEQAEQLTRMIAGLGSLEAGETRIDTELLDRAHADLGRAFDERHGGWGSAPKFPRADFGRLALRRAFRANDAESMGMLTRTLDAMSRGGIFDHLGGGFARYSTDARWLVPHFEKMLYDNAQLALHYVEAYQFTGREEYARTARETIDYVLRDLRHEEGGFFSAEDADSEGIEGKFYVWSFGEIERLLPEEEFEAFVAAYGVTPAGNWEGANVLERVLDDRDVARRLGVDPAVVVVRLEAARVRLFTARAGRIRPGLDDKILTAWNGMMIEACARASVVLDEPRYLEAARQASDFVFEKLQLPGVGLARRWRQGEAKYGAYAEDYACFVAGLLELSQAALDTEILARARDLHDEMFARFGDADGTLFNTRADADDLILRAKLSHDGSTPSPNSIAAANALRLAELTGEARFAEQAHTLVAAFAPTLRRAPLALASMLSTVDALLAERVTVVLAYGDEGAARTLTSRLRRVGYHPDLHLVGRSEADAERTGAVAPLTRERGAGSAAVLAYACRNGSCALPTADASELIARIGTRRVDTEEGADPGTPSA